MFLQGFYGSYLIRTNIFKLCILKNSYIKVVGGNDLRILRLLVPKFLKFFVFNFYELISIKKLDFDGIRMIVIMMGMIIISKRSKD